MNFEIKKSKRARGMEGDAFSGDLHVDGKKVATFYNSGTGGPTDVSFVRSVVDAEEKAICVEARRVVVAREESREAIERAAAPNATTNKNGIEWGWYADHIRDEKRTSNLGALEALIDAMMDDEHVLAPIRRAAKKGLVLVKKTGNPAGRYFTTKLPPGANVAQEIARAERDGFVVVSARPESEWLALVGAC